MTFFEKLLQLQQKHNGKKLCVIIGYPVIHSLSPAMHNNAYKSIGLDNLYVYDKMEVKAEELRDFMSDLKQFNSEYKLIVGLTCTMPHKQTIMNYLDEVKNEAKIINAVNSVFFNGEKYIGYNSDWYGIERPFVERNIELKNKKVAVLGAGGASRSAVYTFIKNGCKVNIFNRTLSKAQQLAEEFNCKYYSLDENEKIKDCDIILNATSVGMGELIDLSPIDLDVINKNHIVFDCIYKPNETKLIQQAIKVGATVVYGWEMLLYQGVLQFEIYTGKKPILSSMREVL